MSLNSFVFLLLFLPIVISSIRLLGARARPTAARGVLLVASLVFSLSNGLSGFVILLVSITVNWQVARILAREEQPPSRRRLVLTAALLGNVSLLAFFKFAPALYAWVLSDARPAATQLSLGFPLGLSFFTLTQLMYLVDCYERLVKPSTWVDHATFVAFFPNLTAGPLLRSRLFSAQLPRLGTSLSADGISQASMLIGLGLLKKVMLGDSFSKVASGGFAHLPALSTSEAWMTTIASTLELYFDFSGYSDMALGCAALMGLSLVRNFNVPYRSATISEFWRRWHISLSDFISTYLYTPVLRLMGRATLRTSAIAAIISMVVAGIWHGASLNYVMFGLLHGLALATYQYWKRLKRPLPRALAIALTFAFVNIAFITVRTADLTDSWRLFQLLFSGTGHLFPTILVDGIASADIRLIVPPLLVGAVAAFWGPTAEQLSLRFRSSVATDAALMAMLLLAYMYTSGGQFSDFRYRQF